MGTTVTVTFVHATFVQGIYEPELTVTLEIQVELETGSKKTNIFDKILGKKNSGFRKCFSPNKDFGCK